MIAKRSEWRHLPLKRIAAVKRSPRVPPLASAFWSIVRASDAPKFGDIMMPTFEELIVVNLSEVNEMGSRS